MASTNTQIEYFGKTDLLYLLQLISSELAKYQKAQSGKGLSTEDFTTALKEKLEGIDLSKYSTTVQMNDAIDEAIKSVTGLKFQKVDQLPATGSTGIIYLVPKSKAGTSDVFDEYYWDADNNKFELFGSTTIDLTDYVQFSDLKELTSDEVKAVWDSVFTS